MKRDLIDLAAVTTAAVATVILSPVVLIGKMLDRIEEKGGTPVIM